MKNEEGYILVGVLMLTTLAGIIIATSLQLSRDHSRNVVLTKQRTRSFYQAEETANLALNFLQQNSRNMANLFSRDSFYSTFEKSAPTYGTNDDVDLVKVETLVKVRDTYGKSLIILNDDSLADTNSPVFQNPDTGLTFDPQLELDNTYLGKLGLKATLINAFADDPSKDFGDPSAGNHLPRTDFNPVYRVDVLDKVNRGIHSYHYFVGKSSYGLGDGFYGQDYVDFRQNCDSYKSSTSTYPLGKEAGCTVGSDSEINITNNATIFGEVTTNEEAGINLVGDVCATLAPGCPSAGKTCSGPQCEVTGLPIYGIWYDYCPSSKGTQIVSSPLPQIIPVTSASPTDSCWDTLKVRPLSTIILNTTVYNYYIETLDLANNASIIIQPTDPNGTVNLYVKEIVGDKLNGNQIVNLNKPTNLKLHYLGTDTLVLNGTAAMSAFIVAPNAEVKVQGTFEFYGSIRAKRLTATGAGKLHYDSSGDTNVLTHISFTERIQGLKYR